MFVGVGLDLLLLLLGGGGMSRLAFGFLLVCRVLGGCGLFEIGLVGVGLFKDFLVRKLRLLKCIVLEYKNI